MRVSDYLVLGETTFTDPKRDHVDRLRIVYQTSKAKVLASPDHVVAHLRDNHLEQLSPAETDSLLELGILVPDHLDEKSEIIEYQRSASTDPSSHAFVLVPTSYCNMGCDYCGQTHRKRPYSPEHRAAVEARVLDAINDPQIKKVEVRWFGGEPTMAWASIRSMSQKFIEAAEINSTEYHALIVTNGALVNPRKLHEMHDYHINEICVTVDGVGELHNTHRPLKSGKGSFDRIMEWLHYANDHHEELPNLHVTVRTNVDVNNFHQYDRFIETMADGGFSNSPNISFTIAPVYAWSNDVSSIRLEKSKFAEQESQWILRMTELGLNIPLVPGALRTALCPAVSSNEEVLSATGSVFSCTEHPLVDEHEANDTLGTVTSLPWPALRPRGKFDGWHDDLYNEQQPCNHCTFLPVCGGACPKHWSESDPPCPSYKFDIQNRLDAVAASNGLTKV